MVQRVLVKLDVMKQYEKKRLSKYELIECRKLGRVQVNPCVRTPLTFDLNLNYELSRSVKSSISVTPSTQHVIQDDQSAVQQSQRPQSQSTQRKDHSGKPVVRLFSAPSYLKHKPTNQRVNMEALDGGFTLLKLKQRLKSAHSATEVQKRPGRMSEDERKYLSGMDDYHRSISTGTSCEDGRTTAVVGKGVYDEAKHGVDQELMRKGKVKSCTNVHSLQDNMNKRDALWKYDFTNEGKNIKTLTHFEDAVLKKKKVSVPLCIEDEIEKPNAKVIRAGSSRPKCDSLPKSSESFPVYCHNEGYVKKHALNTCLSMYGDGAFYGVNRSGEICMQLNPVLRNNYNESTAITRSKQNSPPNETTKRKKKPALSGKPKRIAVQILSVKKKPCDDIFTSSQKEIVQKMSGSVTKTFSRHTVPERSTSTNMPQRQKEGLMVCGENPTLAIYRTISSRSLISGIKSQLPDFFEKELASPEEPRKKDRVLFVDYIPISKPIPVPRSGSKLANHHNSVPSARSLCSSHSCAKIVSVESSKSEVKHQDNSHQKPFLDENRASNMEVSAQSPIQEDSERLIGPTSSLSLRSFQEEVNSSLEPQKSELTACSEEQSAGSAHAPVISIPTAEFDVSESHRDPSMQNLLPVGNEK
ncbi:uncharacterized protein LOC128415634 isoform X1 [Podarcis raffonei]|uniref:uncharacterized protein LOC128415634 isoform X1 n=2 Tax=Podarcis raffonei TaxID=65483 RepID=UPI002329384B|nr:uncharacterized protein LOC128415634 isoform X1 [Podarcis raffonei]XP_053248090.1 uncharacterized protein LOC128415634 isoform X1 [Podarcis raffonei]